jgi:hypothetical protein
MAENIKTKPYEFDSPTVNFTKWNVIKEEGETLIIDLNIDHVFYYPDGSIKQFVAYIIRDDNSKIILNVYTYHKDYIYDGYTIRGENSKRYVSKIDSGYNALYVDMGTKYIRENDSTHKSLFYNNRLYYVRKIDFITETEFLPAASP